MSLQEGLLNYIKKKGDTIPVYGVFYAPVFSDAHMCLCLLRACFVECNKTYVMSFIQCREGT